MDAPRQFVKFCAVGSSNTALSFIAFAVAVRAGVPYLAASCGAFALGALNGYTLNRVWTFRSGPFTGRGLARYGLVQGLGLAANASLLAAIVEVLGVASIPAQAIVLPAVSVLTFALNRRWTFAPTTLSAAGGAGRPSSAYPRSSGWGRRAATCARSPDSTAAR
jgi:putative flippase GtrA